jgi:hypothetical protein
MLLCCRLEPAVWCIIQHSATWCWQGERMAHSQCGICAITRSLSHLWTHTLTQVLLLQQEWNHAILRILIILSILSVLGLMKQNLIYLYTNLKHLFWGYFVISGELCQSTVLTHFFKFICNGNYINYIFRAVIVFCNVNYIKYSVQKFVIVFCNVNYINYIVHNIVIVSLFLLLYSCKWCNLLSLMKLISSGIYLFSSVLSLVCVSVSWDSVHLAMS